MKELSKNDIIVNKNINDIFNVLYEDNYKLLTTLFDLREYNKGVWENNIRIDTATIYLEEFPNILSNLFLNNEKIIKVKCINILNINTPNEYTIETKISVINNLMFLIINKLKLIKIKNIINIKKINEGQSQMNIKTKIKSYIVPPFKEIVEKFAFIFCRTILDKSIKYIL